MQSWHAWASLPFFCQAAWAGEQPLIQSPVLPVTAMCLCCAQGKDAKKLREVFVKVAKERSDAYNTLWIDPAKNPQVSISALPYL